MVLAPGEISHSRLAEIAIHIFAVSFTLVGIAVLSERRQHERT